MLSTTVGIDRLILSRNVLIVLHHSFLPTSIIVSLLSLSIETYSIFRLLFIIAPPSFPLQRRLDALTDVRILRMASLVLFDMIIMVPNAINTTYAGDTVPYSVAALIVLCEPRLLDKQLNHTTYIFQHL